MIHIFEHKNTYFFLFFRLVFVVGKSNKRVDNLLIADEAKYFGDIVQVKYMYNTINHIFIILVHYLI